MARTCPFHGVADEEIGVLSNVVEGELVKLVFDVVEEGGARLRNKYETSMQSAAHNLYIPTTPWRLPNVEET